MAVIQPEVCFPSLFVLFLISQKNFNILIKLLLLLVLYALVFAIWLVNYLCFLCNYLSARTELTGFRLWNVGLRCPCKCKLYALSWQQHILRVMIIDFAWSLLSWWIPTHFSTLFKVFQITLYNLETREKHCSPSNHLFIIIACLFELLLEVAVLSCGFILCFNEELLKRLKSCCYLLSDDEIIYMDTDHRWCYSASGTRSCHVLPYDMSGSNT